MGGLVTGRHHASRPTEVFTFWQPMGAKASARALLGDVLFWQLDNVARLAEPFKAIFSPWGLQPSIYLAFLCL